MTGVPLPLALKKADCYTLHFSTFERYFHIIIITDHAQFCAAILLWYPLIPAQGHSWQMERQAAPQTGCQAMTRLIHKMQNYFHTYGEFIHFTWVVCSHTVGGNTHKHGGGNMQAPQRKGSKFITVAPVKLSSCEAAVWATVSPWVTSI